MVAAYWYSKVRLIYGILRHSANRLKTEPEQNTEIIQTNARRAKQLPRHWCCLKCEYGGRPAEPEKMTRDLTDLFSEVQFLHMLANNRVPVSRTPEIFNFINNLHYFLLKHFLKSNLYD